MKKDENHNVKKNNKTKENINNGKIKKIKADNFDKINDFNKTENSNKTKNTDSKLTIILKLILVFCVFILVGMLIFDIHSRIVVDDTLNDVTNELDKIILENKEKINIVDEETIDVGIVSQPKKMSVNIGNSKVYGKIKIDKIDIEYPIIEYVNDDSLWKSICKISNNTVNGTGNLCLAGHNMRNLTMFGKLRWVEKGDIIEVTNIYGDVYKYKVYDTFYVEPENVEVTKNTAEPIITLITCNNTSSKRLIVKGKLI